jgi:hypothetical protein
MSPPVKLAGFAALLALVFGVAAVAGDAVGPDATGERIAHDGPAGGGAGHGSTGGLGAGDRTHPVRGLAVAEGGLRLVVDDPELSRGEPEALRFRIVDDRDETVRDFEVEHERRMHLILVRRDMTGFRHLHPEQDADGSWRASIELSQAGSYRAFADFSRSETPYTLASDLRVDGAADLRDLPPAETTADAGDGYEVRREPGELGFTVLRDGEPVHVEPYLGAGGHLVALREGDLAFLHVHPIEPAEDEGAGQSDAVAFEATFPTPGRYRLFLQFKHRGTVRTAAFTEEVR